jgi:hypothetical protein
MKKQLYDVVVYFIILLIILPVCLGAGAHAFYLVAKKAPVTSFSTF